MSATVQRIVDRVADDVRRPAVVLDNADRLVAYSAHTGTSDEVRRRTILHRRAVPEVTEWLRRIGFGEMRSPTRLPGNPALGMLPRVCFPLCQAGASLGCLTFVESGEPMSVEDIVRAGQGATELAIELFREATSGEPPSVRMATALRELLCDRTDGTYAARQLVDDGFVQAGDRVTAVVLTPFETTAPADQEVGEHAVGLALRAIAQTVPTNKALPLSLNHHGVLLLPLAEGEQRGIEARIAAIANAARLALAQVSTTIGVIVGVGDARPNLRDAAASYREARLAARTGVMLRGRSDTVYWTNLGVYQVVAELVDESSPPRVVHPGLRALIGDPDMLPLLETLETYLDVAGNAQLAAEALNLHRGSLYHRLQRIEQLAGTTLKDGIARLSLHIELKIARLAGDYLPRGHTNGGARSPVHQRFEVWSA